MKAELLNLVQDSLDYSSRARRRVEDAGFTLHLHSTGTHTVDFSSPFNTIQPNVLAQKLLSDFDPDFNLVCWIADFPHRVKVSGTLSKCCFSSTGPPRGHALSPLLYKLLHTTMIVSTNTAFLNQLM